MLSQRQTRVVIAHIGITSISGDCNRN